MREPLVAHDATISIGAGGIVPLGAKLPEDQRSSPVTARAYRHPALDGNVIVRLEPDAVAAGTDAEMAAFGFTAPAVSEPLGRVRYRTLGFPAWALLHEPKKAAAALAVTDDVRKAKRLVAAKPGHAKEAFEKIAKQLQRTAPQFLPSFWEEAGRVVADGASSTLAAQCFERARQAERAYKLKTDPEDSDAVFVEFALLGALSAKTLSAYAKELARSAGGREAYRRYRAIIVKRALGGMPPYSGMGKDLRALAAAAGADAGTEDEALVAELIEAPGVGKAPIEFWTTYRDVLVRLGKARPEVRARLRAIWPAPRGGSDESRLAFKATWLDLLAETGALDDLPDAGLGAWVSRLIKFGGAQPRAAEILRAFAPRIVALGQPIAVLVEGGWAWDQDLHLDLAELALSLGVALVDPREQDDFSASWMTCDPVRVAADPRYGKKLVALLARCMGNKDYEHAMLGKQGFVTARRQWIEERVAVLEASPLPACAAALDELEQKTTAETFLPFGDLHARLAAIDLASALAAQLRGGCVDELGWPAYEEALARLGGEIAIGGAFPIATAWNQSKVIAIGKDGVIAEHDLVYKPADHTVEGVLHLDGQFLVVLSPKKGWQEVAYWSGAPKQRFDREAHVIAWGGDTPTAWTTPAGAVSLGGKAFRAGAAPTGMARFVATRDALWQPDGKLFRTFDPDTGKRGGPASPPFVGMWAPRAGWSLDPDQCVLVPAPEGLASSPLGLRDGLLGLRCRTRDAADADDYTDQPTEVERIDGVRWEGTLAPFALLQLPGDPAPRPLTTHGSSSKRFLGAEGPATQVWAPDGKSLGSANDDAWVARGWGAVHVPPAAFWDYLTPRDEAASHALRTITVDAARAILDAARVEVAAGGELGKRALPLTEAAARAIRPVFTDDKLIRGIAGVAEYAAELANRLALIAAERAKENADPSGHALVGEGAQLRKLATALAAGRATKIADFEADVPKWLAHGRALAALSLSPLASDDERRTARDMVRALAGTILADDVTKLRVLELEEPDDHDDEEWNTLAIRTHEHSVFAIHASASWALELSLDGVFRAPPPWKLVKERRLARGIGTLWADRFLELPDGGVAWDPAIAERIAKRADLSLAEATLLYTGAPERDAYNRDFLGKQRRELVGLKLADADAARTTFKDLDDDTLYGIVGAAVPDDPLLLATPLAAGGFADRLADAWKAKHGARARIPQELIALAKKELDLGDELGVLLPAFAGDDAAWFLRADLRPYHDLGGWNDGHGLTATKAREVATLIGWLFLQRPVGCAIRAGIPRVLAKLRDVLADPRVLWKFDDLYIDDDDAKGKARRRQLLELVGGEPFDPATDPDDPPTASRDDGTCVTVLYAHHATAAFRPAKLGGRATAKIEQLAKLMVEGGDSWGDPPIADVRIAQLLAGDRLAALAERVATTDVPDGHYEANPLLSAPRLVAKVAKAHALSDDAAALYLQTLALAEPTQQKVTLWNGWKPKQYRAAAAELVKKKLVTEGKRERAGRSIFLKGGYMKGDRKNLPMEEWKQPFYDVLSRHVITEPVHALFARAYKRIESGDRP